MSEQSEKMRLLVVIPTYNEIENIRDIIPAVLAVIPQDAAVLVADDASPDGTGAAVRELMNEFSGRLYLKEGQGKQGLANAYISSFKWGMDPANVDGKEFNAFLEMDADFSHKPEYIPHMLEALASYDVVIGSRNIRGGAVEGWSALRNCISKGGSLYSHLVLACPVKDLTGGFNLWRKTALERIGLDSIISRGYAFQIEMKYRAYRAGCSIKEIPIVFPDRKRGQSKMSGGIFTEALKAVWKIRKDCRTAGKAGKTAAGATAR